jgi:hypothetical protein
MYTTTDVQGMQMAAEAIKPVLAYSVPLGIYTEAHVGKCASLAWSIVNTSCGFPVSTRNAWALLDRMMGGLGAVDITQVAVSGITKMGC